MRTDHDEPCPSEDDLAAYLREGPAGGISPTVDAHIARCVVCHQLLLAMARIASAGPHRSADSVSPTLPLDARSEPTELPIEARFGRYLVLGWLGAGGMGVVYAAHDPELNRKVALKVLRDEGTDPVDRVPIRDLLLREAQAMAQLAHPNVVAVFDVGSVDNRVFIAMELVDGQTLAQWLRTKRRDRDEIVAVFVAAGQGLAAAHAAGLIHRDFKPDNVLIGNDGRVRVTDFGLARSADGGPSGAAYRGAAGPDRSRRATGRGIAGTPAYMAPERHLGRPADARSDQFSFAVALYEALHGERPFTVPQLAGAAHPASGAVVPPRPGDMSLAVHRVLLRALSLAPEQRYPSMAALLDDLAPARPSARPSRRIAAGAAAVMAVALALAGYALHVRNAAEERTQLVGRLRGLAPEIRTRLSRAHMLPLHDIRSAHEDVGGTMREVERLLQTPAGQDEIALGTFVLGEAQQALGDHERALSSLEAAWTAGERGPDIDAALGYELGARYESQLDEIERAVPSADRGVRIRAIESRYRDPAMLHLRAALATGNGSPAYVQALIAFHDHRLAESSRTAHAAFVESPTLFEAGALEARAHDQLARALLSAGKLAEANDEFLAARRVFQSVLEVARSDDEMWLGYAAMVHDQAVALARDGEMPAELRQEVVAALRNVQRINPDNWQASLREARIHTSQGNIEVLWYRDPAPYVERTLVLAEQARAHGAPADQVDVYVCLAYWERAGYEGTRGVDPRPDFQQALAACTRAIAATPSAYGYVMVGEVYAWMAVYEAQHGSDATPLYELMERNLRLALAIDDDAGTHYGLGRLSTFIAHDRASHGQDPQRAVDGALAEYETTVRMAVTRCDAWIESSNVLVARAEFQHQQHDDPRATLAYARSFLAKGLAIEPTNVPAIRYRALIAELEAEAVLERGADPTVAIGQMRADAHLLASRAPNDSVAHVLACRAELLSARWSLARHQAADAALARAAAEATAARDADARNALAWTASAEVEQLRVAAALARGAAPNAAAITRGETFVERSIAIDPRLVRTLNVRDALARACRGAPSVTCR